MTTVDKPRSNLEAVEAIAPTIREHADESEREATLARPIVEAMREARLFHHVAPRSLGGGEVDPITAFRTVEALARIDGSTGWCAWTNGGTGLAGQEMDDAHAEAIFADPNFIAAEVLFPPGKAVAVDGGYRVTGRWPFASGCKHATHISPLCIVFDGDQPRMTPEGPEMRAPFIPTSSVTILDTWDVSGLSGTGSHDVVVDDVFVEEGYAVPMMGGPGNRHYTGPLYRMPLLTFHAWPIAAVTLGIAQHAMDVMLEVAQTKVPAAMAATDPKPMRDRPLFHLQLGEAVACVRSARAWLYEALGELWEIAQSGAEADTDARVNMAAACANATRSSIRAVELMYLAGGGGANYRKSPLQRCMRDIHAVSQHFLTSPAALENSGAVFAGAPPSNPLLLL